MKKIRLYYAIFRRGCFLAFQKEPKKTHLEKLQLNLLEMSKNLKKVELLREDILRQIEDVEYHIKIAKLERDSKIARLFLSKLKDFHVD